MGGWVDWMGGWCMGDSIDGWINGWRYRKGYVDGMERSNRRIDWVIRKSWIEEIEIDDGE